MRLLYFILYDSYLFLKSICMKGKYQKIQRMDSLFWKVIYKSFNSFYHCTKYVYDFLPKVDIYAMRIMWTYMYIAPILCNLSAISVVQYDYILSWHFALINTDSSFIPSSEDFKAKNCRNYKKCSKIYTQIGGRFRSIAKMYAKVALRFAKFICLIFFRKYFLRN